MNEEWLAAGAVLFAGLAYAVAAFIFRGAVRVVALTLTAATLVFFVFVIHHYAIKQ